jgi:hypothetical protein
MYIRTLAHAQYFPRDAFDNFPPVASLETLVAVRPSRFARTGPVTSSSSVFVFVLAFVIDHLFCK